MDRTLVDPGASEGAACRRFFSDLVLQGVTYGFATSRSYPSLHAVIPDSMVNAGFAICSDGAISFVRSGAALAAVNRAILSSASRVLDIVLRFRPGQASVFVFYDDRANLAVGTSIHQAHRALVRGILQGRDEVPLHSHLNNSVEAVLSVGLLASRIDCVKVAELLRTSLASTEAYRIRVYEELRYPSSGHWWCDVSAWDADKGIALDVILQSLTMPGSLEPCVFLGDGANDVGIAKRADLVLCPPWADAALRSMAVIVQGVKDCSEFVEAVAERLHEPEKEA